MAQYYIGGENQSTIERLLAGETVIVKGKRNYLSLARLGTLLNYNFEINPITISFRKDDVYDKV